jgi:hypothetical protein
MGFYTSYTARRSSLLTLLSFWIRIQVVPHSKKAAPHYAVVNVKVTLTTKIKDLPQKDQRRIDGRALAGKAPEVSKLHRHLYPISRTNPRRVAV